LTDPVRVLQAFYAAQARFYAGEEAELADYLGPDVVWHVPGDNAIAGTYRGRSAVLGYFRHRREMSKGTFRVRPGKILRSGQLLLQFARGETELAGRQTSWETIGVFLIREQQIAACWLVPFDQTEFDRIWSS
jgi:ketosteroid isomerase-like protein